MPFSFIFLLLKNACDSYEFIKRIDHLAIKNVSESPFECRSDSLFLHHFFHISKKINKDAYFSYVASYVISMSHIAELLLTAETGIFSFKKVESIFTVRYLNFICKEYFVVVVYITEHLKVLFHHEASSYSLIIQEEILRIEDG